MREIKFRGIRVDNGEWIHGFYREVYMYYDYTHKRGEITYYKDGSLCIFEVFPETVGQYTGLKDKNGVEIYEGDIVKYYLVDNSYKVVFSESVGFCFFDEYGYAHALVEDETEIVGNIYDGVGKE